MVTFSPAPAPTPTSTANAASTTNTVMPKTNSNTLSGAADGDSGQKQPTKPNIPSTPAGTNTTPNVTSGTADPSREKPQTPPDKPATANPKSTSPVPFPNIEKFTPQGGLDDRPGQRLYNPLGYLSSYTYQLSLYMITPDAYQAFVNTGRKNLSAFQDLTKNSNYDTVRRQSIQAAVPKDATEQDAFKGSTAVGGVYLIAQSGGIDNASENRAPYFQFDYGIDKLKFTHLVSPENDGSAVQNTEISFTITEPYGFSFISNLNRANNELISYAAGETVGSIPAAKQFYILGIRFYGYDKDGNAVKGTNLINGQVLDPSATGTALFETFYDIVITSMTTKLSGNAATYDITAASAATATAVNQKKGMFTEGGTTFTGTTVRDILLGENGVLTKLNKSQLEKVKSKTITYPITYGINWIGDAKDIAFSSIVSDSDTDKAKQSGSGAVDSSYSNPALEIKATPNSNARSISFHNNIPITQVIDLVIARSQYIENMFKFNYTDNPTYNAKTNSADVNKPDTKNPVTWFNISPKLSNLKWDPLLKDWSCDITYEIQTYLIPIVDNPYISKTMKYYGPHKRYEYWYTGENREIINYNQTLETQWFNVALSGDTTDPPTSGSGNASDNQQVGTSKASGVTQTQPGGGGSPRTAVISGFRTSLYDPQAYAQAQIEILGDPDYLMQDTAYGINDVYRRHYGNDFTVNATGGQVFFEINFLEAIDYNARDVVVHEVYSAQGGTLSLNSSIEFWRYPDDAAMFDENGEPIVKGLSYKLINVESSFTNGVFKQVLTGAINTFGGDEAVKGENERQADTQQATQPGASPDNAQAGKGSQGTKQDPPPKTGGPQQPNKTPTAKPPAPPADDDMGITPTPLFI